ncbi:hypothetical protein F5Y15DRAFT_271417 [Xylariaceae sp. FL0016]|nr:hypothetical protein F5Y15DRAFT_271417 [Xylariaceae sp. FL0016]
MRSERRQAQPRLPLHIPYQHCICPACSVVIEPTLSGHVYSRAYRCATSIPVPIQSRWIIATSVRRASANTGILLYSKHHRTSISVSRSSFALDTIRGYGSPKLQYGSERLMSASTLQSAGGGHGMPVFPGLGPSRGGEEARKSTRSIGGRNAPRHRTWPPGSRYINSWSVLKRESGELITTAAASSSHVERNIRFSQLLDLFKAYLTYRDACRSAGRLSKATEADCHLRLKGM